MNGRQAKKQRRLEAEAWALINEAIEREDAPVDWSILMPPSKSGRVIASGMLGCYDERVDSFT